MKKVTALTMILIAVKVMPALANKEHKEQKLNHYFSKMDADGNGSISKTENDRFATQMFDKADANNDNMISKDDLRAHKEHEKSEFKNKVADKNAH